MMMVVVMKVVMTIMMMMTHLHDMDKLPAIMELGVEDGSSQPMDESHGTYGMAEGGLDLGREGTGAHVPVEHLITR